VLLQKHRDALYVRCLHVPALSVGMKPHTAAALVGLDHSQAAGTVERAKEIKELLNAPVAVLMGEFEEALEWVDAQISGMLRPKRSSGSGLDGVDTQVDGGKGSAYGALVEAAGLSDWDQVIRLLEQPDQPVELEQDTPREDFKLRAWQRVAQAASHSSNGASSNGGVLESDQSGSALHAAALGGHEAMLLYLMYKTAVGMKLDARPGDQVFCSTVYQVVKLLPKGPARARADYSFRALVMLRGQKAYTQRLDYLCAAVGVKQAWMDEEEEGLFSACFGDLQVNAELGRAVARELEMWMASCVDKRQVLQGLSASHAIVNAIIFAIKSVQHQFERVDKLARPRLSTPSSLPPRWRAFVQQVEASMGEREGLSGQRLSDLLSWPLQRSMRYKDLVLDLINGITSSCEVSQDKGIAHSGVTARQLLEAIASQPLRLPTAVSASPSGNTTKCPACV